MERYHYTYSISFAEIPHIYFGVRSSKCLPEEDVRYLGSPVRHKQYWKKHTPIKSILDVYLTRESAEVAERSLIATQWEKDKLLSLNARMGVLSWNTLGMKPSQKQMEAVRNAHLGKVPSPETKQTIREKLSKPYYLVSPAGATFQGLNLFQFCKDNNLHNSSCFNVIKGNVLHSQGWTSSIDAHHVYMEYYDLRGLSIDKKAWKVQWCKNGNQYKYFKNKSDALAYRDELELNSHTFIIKPRGWKARLVAMQAESKAA
ncbi:MAG: hypothetical protein KME47_09995 [Nodosilinea sp. WJT8-NPBG4]|jgi:hypothetical protein|nr:hypothetical protein [Nodosilinea sp. WJT8-NPBG4]